MYCVQCLPTRFLQVPSGAGPTSLRPPVAQGDILGILQREQDHTTSLLSLNSSLSSLLISVSRRVVVLESAASTTPPPESEEYKCLQTILTVLREENRELKQEARDKRDSAEASQEAFRSRVSSLERANTDQQDDITSLRAELLETRTQHAQLMVDSNTEVTALQVQVVDLEVRFWNRI